MTEMPPGRVRPKSTTLRWTSYGQNKLDHVGLGEIADLIGTLTSSGSPGGAISRIAYDGRDLEIDLT